MIKQITKAQAPLICLIVFGILGVLNISKVGISWDEPAQRLSAGLSVINSAQKISPSLVPEGYKAFVDEASNLSTNATVDHGVAFDAPVLILESLLGLESTRNIYLFHHLMNWISFLIGLVSMYLICLLIFKRREIAFIGASMLAFSPRILAESFYNSKDLPFLSFFLLSTLFCLKLLSDPTKFRNALFAGIVGGYATDIRILGLVQIPIFIIVLFAFIYQNRENLSKKIQSSLIYLGSFALSVYVFYPYLWSNPVGNLIEVFSKMSNFQWPGYVLYFGDRILATQVPWHYIPVWILITTPLFYILLFLFGLASNLIELKDSRKHQFSNKSLQMYYFYMCLFVPVLTVILFNSTLYDGWRHLYFVYPFLLIIALEGYVYLEKKAHQFKKVFYGLCLGSMIYIIGWVLVMNPNQFMYFNRLAGTNIENTWEMDYWGLANEQALRYILKSEKSEKITIQEVSFTPLEVSSKMLSTSEQSRFVFENSASPKTDYIINNFRSSSPDSIKGEWEGYGTFFQFKSGDTVYLEVLKRDQ